MFTYLTTYSSSVSIDTSSFYSRRSSYKDTILGYGNNTNNLFESYEFSNDAYTYSSTDKSKSTQFTTSMYGYGLQNNDEGVVNVDNLKIQGYNGYTQSFSPFSVYNGSGETQYGSTEDFSTISVILGRTQQMTFTVHNLGSMLVSTIDGYYTIISTTANGATYSDVGEYAENPDIKDIVSTTFSAPVFTDEETTINIKTTTQSNTTYAFLGTEYGISTIIETDSSIQITYKTTSSQSTSLNHHIGTVFGTNNSFFTLITDTNSLGEQISPYACYAASPESLYFDAENIAKFTSPTTITPYNTIFVEIGQQSFPPNVEPEPEIITTDFSYIPSTTLTNEYTSQTTTASQRILNYSYNGYTSTFFSETTSYTSRVTSEEEVILYSSSALSNHTKKVYTTTGTFLRSVKTQSTQAGLLYLQNGVSDGSLSTTDISVTNRSYYSITDSAEGGVKYGISTSSTEENDTEFPYTRKTIFLSGISVDVGGRDRFGSFMQTQPWFNTAEVASESLYVGSVNNNENWAGIGKIYKIDTGFVYVKSFTETPAIYYYKNRITYNASKLLKNNGIFSSINSMAYKDYEFPAIGIGSTFSTTSLGNTNTEETVSTTCTQKILVGVSYIYDPFIVTFVLPESSDITNSSFSSFTTWAAVYTNGTLSRTLPNGSSQTIYRNIGYSASESYYGYNTTYNSLLTISPVGSLRNTPEYITIDEPKVLTGEADDIATFTFLNSYYVTEIDKSNLATHTALTSYGSTIFSSINYLIFRPKLLFKKYGGFESNKGLAFLGGYSTTDNYDSSNYSSTSKFWNIGSDPQNTIFNFTSYVGSTYIDA